MEKKQCLKCGRELPITEFYKNYNGVPVSPCKQYTLQRAKKRRDSMTPSQRYEKRKKEQRKLSAMGIANVYERTDFQQAAHDACEKMFPMKGNYFALGFMRGAEWAINNKH